MKPITVSITSIGSGVAQAIVDSCNMLSLRIRTAGIGTNSMAYGQFDCDEHAAVPASGAIEYPTQFLSECENRGIKLLIPVHDVETVVLSQHAVEFEHAGVAVLVAGRELVGLCYDKKKMADQLGKHSELFVETFERQQALGAIASGAGTFPLVSKLRAGYASRGVRTISTDEELLRVSED
jgi:carbamoylphosphate synthase large subunit